MNTKKQTLLLGAHISVSGGLEQAFFRGESLGCTTMQIFTKSNRQWHCKPLTASEIDLFKKRHAASMIQTIIVHASYLINLGSANPEVLKKSIRGLKEELLRCEQLGIPYLVLHPGSNGTHANQKTLIQIAQELDNVFQSVPGTTMILLETMAGQGSSVCHQFEQLATIYTSSRNKTRLGVCLDTCHIFAAGYDIRIKEDYDKTIAAFDRIIGLNALRVIHINDSKKELGSRVDRHEHIGKGKLGLEPFRLLFNDKRFFNIPKILETPKEHLRDDLENMKKVVSLLDLTTKQALEIRVVNEIFEAKSKQ